MNLPHLFVKSSPTTLLTTPLHNPLPHAAPLSAVAPEDAVGFGQSGHFDDEIYSTGKGVWCSPSSLRRGCVSVCGWVVLMVVEF
jgi:hypothetical protein